MNERSLVMTLVAVWVLVATAIPTPAAAKPMAPPRDIPFERLETNLLAFIAKHPDQAASGHYALGRLHALAYALAAEEIDDVFPGSEDHLPGFHALERSLATFLPVVAAQWRERVRAAYAAPPARPEDIEETLRGPHDAARHLRQAVERYDRALELDATLALAHLGIAWCREEAGELEIAIESYRRAYRTAREGDLAQVPWQHLQGMWHGSVAREAGTRLLELLADVSGDQAQAERTEIAATVEALHSEEQMWISPILVPLTPVSRLDELLDPARIVRFDLDGDGIAELRPWVNPTAALLVWDPTKSGRVESGRQLFGSVTWAIPWAHGYEPLALLDDDGDGRIAGAELEGLALWRDSDQDGVSDPGEVRPIGEWGVTSLDPKATFEGECPHVPAGVEFEKGEVRPTWDWFPPPGS